MPNTLADLVAAERNVRRLTTDLVTDGAPAWEITTHSDLARYLRRRIIERTA